VLFLNENIGGHVTVHLHLRQALRHNPGVQPRWVDVPPPGLLRRLIGAPVPCLAALDLDLQPLRSQLAHSVVAHRLLGRAIPGCDVVHAYTHNAVLTSARLLASMPSVVTLDSTNAQNAYLLPYRRPTRFTHLTVRATAPFERRVYAAATLVIAQSRWAAGSLHEDYGVPADKVRVVPFGITPPTGPPARPGVGRPRIAFVGRSLERKGGRLLLEVWRERLRDRCDLLLVTPETVMSEAGLQVVGDLSPGDARLWDLLRASAVFALPSQIDQAPNSVVEAMAAGLPVVAFSVGAIPEMVDHGASGLLVEPGDLRGLAGALERLVDSAEVRTRMGKTALVRAREQFDATVASQRLLAVLHEATLLWSSTRPVPYQRSGAVDQV